MTLDQIQPLFSEQFIIDVRRQHRVHRQQRYLRELHALLGGEPRSARVTHPLPKPMDAPDHGSRHMGRCRQLEALWCLYRVDTGDTAAGHIADLSKLKSYAAFSTQITNRSLELLA